MAMDALAAANPRLVVEYAFACDTNAASRAVIAKHHTAPLWYNDIFSADFAQSPRCDVLIAGFPCQPFSSEGLQHGPRDNRSTVIHKILEYAARCHPALLLLENVRGLYTGFPAFFLGILSHLQALGYVVGWNLLNSMTHGGAPQCRNRIYIVAIHAPRARTRMLPMQWPRPIAMRSLHSILDRTPYGKRLPPGRPGNQSRRKVVKALRLLKSMGVHHRTAPVVCDCDGISGRIVVGHIPCLTAARASRGGFWLIHKGRKLTINEMLKLQGMDPARINFDGLGLRESKIGRMIGDAFTQTVVTRILAKALPLTGLTGALRDPVP